MTTKQENQQKDSLEGRHEIYVKYSKLKSEGIVISFKHYIFKIK